MQRFTLYLVCAGTLAVLPASAAACLWDREMVPHEKQFKSNYLEQPGPYGSVDARTRSSSWIGLWGGGAAGLMLVSALLIGFVRGRGRLRPPARGERFDGDRP
jgi:hypothetical protein